MKGGKLADRVVWQMKYHVTLSNGRSFQGTARSIADMMRLITGNKWEPRHIIALIGAARANVPDIPGMAAYGGTLLWGGGTVAAVSATSAGCMIAAGAVLVTEVTFLGWQLYDIGSSAAEYCDADGTLIEFFGDTCQILLDYQKQTFPPDYCEFRFPKQ